MSDLLPSEKKIVDDFVAELKASEELRTAIRVTTDYFGFLECKFGTAMIEFAVNYQAAVLGDYTKAPYFEGDGLEQEAILERVASLLSGGNDELLDMINTAMIEHAYEVETQGIVFDETEAKMNECFSMAMIKAKEAN